MPPAQEPLATKINWKYAFIFSVLVTIMTFQFLFLHTSDSNISTSPNVPAKTEMPLEKTPSNRVSANAVAVDSNLVTKTIPKKIKIPVPSTTSSADISPKKSVVDPPKDLPHSVDASPSSGRVLSTPMSWSDFTALPFNEHFEKSEDRPKIVQKTLKTCSADVENRLSKPRLNDEEFKWCRWALSSSGGQVVVGKSWGKLKSKGAREKFDALTCNSVNEGKNPSCDDSWGDIHIRTWQKKKLDNLRCAASKSSDVLCYKNDNSDVYCSIKNAQINFAKMQKVSRGGGMTPSKKFGNDFMSADCKEGQAVEDAFPFPHLYSPAVSSERCDYVYNGTLLMYSHDDIRNLGHTLNDVFNIWIMLWMQGIARHSHEIEMLNIDSFKLGHNFDDQPNAFFTTYYKSLRNILKGIDFGDKTLCVKNLMVQPIPPRFFIWESWFIDLPCSFLGPSSLYQRWNLDVRHNYQLLNIDRSQRKWKVMLVVRNEHSNMWGSQRTSRNFLNTEEIVTGLRGLVAESAFADKFELVSVDLSKLQFVDQLALIAETSLMIGMHGAGLSSAMHMSVGEENCCGVLEIFPSGEFSPIRGHGNMVRKMGIHYDRLDISGQLCRADGASVPVPGLVEKVRALLMAVTTKPSCVLEQVINDPYLED